MDLPKSPQDENETTERAAISRTAKWTIAGFVVVLALMIVLHLSGVTGGSRLHG